MNENLKYIFSNINEWLKFAEAKNGGLLALNAASIIGILQCNIDIFSPYLWFRAMMIILFSVSSLICIFSIAPIVKIFRFSKKMTAAEFNISKNDLNHLFFGHIACLSIDQYIDLLNLKGYQAISIEDKDLIGQIIHNSEITLRKYKTFNIACHTTFLGFVSSICLVILIAIK